MKNFKKYIIVASISVVLLLLIELGFFLFTGKAHYPTKLKNLLAYTSKNIEPISARSELEWPKASILVRAHDIAQEPETLRIGGMKIPGTYLQPSATFKTAQELKNSERKNIYIIGGSAAFGYTCSEEQAFSSLLQKELGPEANVYNAAQVGWCSGQLVPVVKRIADHGEPSLVIIMCGNNELINWSLTKPSPQYETKRKLLELYSNSYTLSYLSYKKIMSNNNLEQYDDGMSFKPHYELSGYGFALQYPADRFTNYDFNEWKVLREDYLKNFEANLTSMIRYCKQAGAEVILMGVPLYYKLPPAWKHPQPWFYNPDNKESIKLMIGQVVRHIKTGLPELALPILDDAIELEPDVSILHYLKAYCLEQTRSYLEAEIAYKKSRDLMVGNLGSIPSMNSVSRNVAEKNKVGFIDLDATFAKYCHTNEAYFNELVMRDDCHPNDIGQQLIAETVLEYLKNDRSSQYQ